MFDRLTAIFLCLLLSGCGFSDDRALGGKKTLRMNNMAEPASLDPALQTVVEEQRLTLALFEGLLAYDPKTLRPIAGIAESWEKSSDGLEFTFRLRNSLWSNGDPLTAYDFLYAWRRVLSPPSTDPARRWSGSKTAIAADYAQLFFVIRGAEDYYRGKSSDFSNVAVRVVDQSTLAVSLARPTPWFEELLCFPTFMPVHQRTVETYGSAWTRPEHFVGNGAFLLAERRMGDHIRVTRNPRYWDAATVGLDAIVYFTTDQIDTALDQYLAGETDWVRTFNPKKVRGWKEDPDLSRALRAPPYLGTYFFRLNCTRPELADRRVRRALSLAIDRAAITKHLCGLGEEPAHGLVPPCISDVLPWRGVGDRGLVFDPKKAREELAAAGFAGGAGFPKIVVSFNSDIRNKAIAEAMQAMWKDHLGISVELLNREKSVHVRDEKKLDYLISRGSWIGDYNDPTTFLEIMRGGAPNNRTGWKNAEYDRLLDQAATEIDQEERIAILERAEEILMVDEAPLLPIFHFRSVMVLRPDAFEGIWDTNRDLHPPKWIKRRDV